ncbi:MAG: RluA family pseudouridine synthase [Oceanococcaceae bacterium]
MTFTVEAEGQGQRLDQLLAAAASQYSRTRLQSWIKAGLVQVDGVVQTTPRAAIEAGQTVRLCAPEAAEPDTTVHPEAIALDIVHEDADILVLHKPAGLTVHPGAGQSSGTLQNALLHHRPELAQVPRAGIVHRLDKLTSGLLVVAANLTAHTALVRALAEREITREYLALVWGEIIAGGTIDAPLGRDPRDRRRYVVGQGGRHAITHFRVEERFARHTLLRVQLETGRTHQIRVHMHHRKWPLVGDPVYGRRGDPLRAIMPRQALHATALGFAHPGDGSPMRFERPVPADMQAVLEELRAQS